MNNDLKQQQLARINFYALLSRITMSEIDEGLLKSIEDDESMLSFFPTYRDWAKKEEMSRKELIEKYLNVDFTNLFLLHLVPYESFYMRDDQMMETGADNPVQQLFMDLNFRVELDKARVMSVDHIGVELEFMYMLCDSERKALEDGNMEVAGEIAEIEYHFLKDHLVQWLPMYLLNVKSEAGTAFYYDVADLTLDFVLNDFEYVNALKNSGYNYEV